MRQELPVQFSSAIFRSLSISVTSRDGEAETSVWRGEQRSSPTSPANLESGETEPDFSVTCLLWHINLDSADVKSLCMSLSTDASESLDLNARRGLSGELLSDESVLWACCSESLSSLELSERCNRCFFASPTSAVALDGEYEEFDESESDDEDLQTRLFILPLLLLRCRRRRSRALLLLLPDDESDPSLDDSDASSSRDFSFFGAAQTGAGTPDVEQLGAATGCGMPFGKADVDASTVNAEPPRRLSKASHSAARLAHGACWVSVLVSGLSSCNNMMRHDYETTHYQPTFCPNLAQLTTNSVFFQTG